ncbi:mannose-1-phosphate guanylyltransferase [Porphyromonadaceae bacterium W3.11]|nr:mannose-1-phosphate guanylyltransferase [Porphyromonadaceae bacterium W3.11]
MSSENNYVVILAGGVGKRFWPYSRKSHPKQFLDFLGLGDTLLQMTYRRFRKMYAPEKIFIVTNSIYKSLVQDQIPEALEENILLEPTSRNTASAIAYASFHIHALNKDAVLVVAPSDHLVTKEDAFITRSQQALELASNEDYIVTLGIKPTYPEVGYGYIQAKMDEVNAEGADGSVFDVKTFIEKPSRDMATVLVDSGEFYWNAGLFMASTRVLLDAFKTHAEEIYEHLNERADVWGTDEEFEYVNNNYVYCPSIAFDYAVMEKATNLKILISDIGWTDVGTWSSIYNLSEKDECGNALVGRANHIFRNSKDNLVVIDDPDMLVVLQGVNDLMVVRRGNVVLVCRRGEEHKLKQILPEAQGIDDKYIQ